MQDTHGLAATVRRAMGTAKGASKWSRAAVYGGTTHLDCISGTKLACNAQRWMLDPAAAPPWHGGYGTVAYTLRKWLRNRGWTEAGPWSWTHPSGPLRLGRGNSVKRVAHAVRCGWREWAFHKLIGTNRHDVKELGTYPSGRGAQIGVELPPLSARCKNQLVLEFRQTDLKRMRHWMRQDPARATVVLGSQVSPAMYDRMHGQQVQAAQCPCARPQQPAGTTCAGHVQAARRRRHQCPDGACKDGLAGRRSVPVIMVIRSLLGWLKCRHMFGP